MEEKSVVEYQARDGSKIKLTPAIIKKYLVSGRSEFVTDQELFIYMGLCKSRGLNPFIKDCHLVKYTPTEGAAIITSIDYYRKRARAQKDCEGWKTGIIVIDTAGKLTYREGCIILDGEKLIGGWSEGTPYGWKHPMRKEVNLKRYIKKTKEGNITRFWSEENQPEMIAKVAESQLLRALWPDEFQGLYVDSEVQSEAAQATFNAAISTPSEPDLASPSFDEVFAEELRDPLFASYLTEAANLYELTDDQVREEFVKQADQIKRLFVAWKKKAEAIKSAQAFSDAMTSNVASATQPIASPMPTAHTPDPPTPIVPPKPTPEISTEPPGKVKTFRDEWINLKPAGYGRFVQAHTEQFKALSPIELGEAIAKWNKFYPGYPCPISPQDQPKVAQQTIAEPPGQAKAQADVGEDVSPEKSELAALRSELAAMASKHGGYVLQAQKELGFSVGLFNLPGSIDGCRVLIEKANEILKERPPKNGN